MTTSLIGDASKLRIFAMAADNGMAIILGVIIASSLPVLGDVARGVVLVAFCLLYFVVSEALWSRTLGKYLMGLVICKLDGSPCGWKEAVIRTLFRTVEVNPLVAGVLPAGLAVVLTKRKQRIGDICAKTVVVAAKQLGR